MKCFVPWSSGDQVVPCGQCTACRINKRRVWVCRMMLEMKDHREAAFLTLTYDTPNLPLTSVSGRPLATLTKEHPQLFLKKLRKRLEPHPIRYFLVGEYGELSGRPHYHAAIYGLQGSPFVAMGMPRQGSLSFAERTVQEAWGLGITQTGILAREAMEYIAGYIQKKMTSVHDMRLDGREPEFSLKSRNLGFGMIQEMASSLLSQDLTNVPDVPDAVRIDGKLWPIGQSLKRRLRVLIGRSPNTPPEVNQVMVAELNSVREFSFARNLNLRDVLSELQRGDAEALVGRDQHFRQRRTM